LAPIKRNGEILNKKINQQINWRDSWREMEHWWIWEQQQAWKDDDDEEIDGDNEDHLMSLPIVPMLTVHSCLPHLAHAELGRMSWGGKNEEMIHHMGKEWFLINF
jgi:hypothetical protein